jgi:hypothetical protein
MKHIKFGIVGGVESNRVHLALRALICLLCQPRVIMKMEKLVEWLAGETEVLGENLPQCRFVHHKPHTKRHILSVKSEKKIKKYLYTSVRTVWNIKSVKNFSGK